MNDMLVSVVIPTYNREKTIEYSLQSVLNQTYRNLEILIVDDCSTDSTLPLVEKMNDPRVRIIRQERNAGAQAARNAGIREASAKWICFNDSDDTWIASKVESQMALLEKFKFDERIVLYCDCYKFYPETGKKELWKLPDIRFDKSYSDLLNTSGPMFQGLMASKKLIVDSGMLDEDAISYQEWDTSLLLSKNGSFHHIKEPFFVYYLHEGDTISKDPDRDFNGYQYIIDKYKDEIVKYNGTLAWKRHLAIQYRKFTSTLLNDNWYKNMTTVMNISNVMRNLSSDIVFKFEIKTSIYRRIGRKIKTIWKRITQAISIG